MRFYKSPFRDFWKDPKKYDKAGPALNPALSVMVGPTTGINSAVDYAKERLRTLSTDQNIGRFHLVELEDMFFINGRPWVRLATEYWRRHLHLHVEDYFLLTRR